MEMDRSSLQVFNSFEDADQADRMERWAMTSEERLLVLEQLRGYLYPDGRTAPRLQRLLESAQLPSS